MKVVNPPKYVAIENYQKALNIYLEKIKHLPGVASVYQMGAFGAPGLSDIDIIVVVEDNFSPDYSSLLSVKGIDDYLFIHGPLIFPRKLAPYIQYIVYASNLRLIWGKNTLNDFEELDKATKELLSKIYVIDFLESRFLQFSSVGFKIDKRGWLTRTWSTVHSVKLLENISEFEIDEEINSLLLVIKSARYQWLKSGEVSDEVFLNSFASAQKLSRIIFVKVLELLYGDASLGDVKVKFYDTRKKILFSDEYRFPKYKSRFLKVLNNKLFFWKCQMPSAYLAHIQNYKIIGDISWAVPPDSNDALASIMNERFKLVRAHVDWLKENASQSQSMRGYLGINSESKIAAKTLLLKSLNRPMTAFL